MTKRRKSWSKIVEEHGITVRLYERAGTISRSVIVAGRKDRKSLGHGDRGLAVDQAKALCAELAKHRIDGTSPNGAPLGVLVRLYTQHRAPLLSARRQQLAKMYAGYFTRHFGDGFVLDDLSQTHVDAYVKARRDGTLVSTSRKGAKRAKDGTIRQELNWLVSVLHWGRTYKANGRRLLSANPLDGVRLPAERNPARPVASEERFVKTLAKADQVDAEGRLRCMLQLARHTGRRMRAITELRASDVLLSRDAILRALAAAGEDERLADHMPQGAIRWRAETDKQGYLELTPLGTQARAALDVYLRSHPVVGEAPIFPSPTDPARPVDKNWAQHSLKRAEALAEVPKLERGLWHPYRRAWCVERKHLPDVDVAKGGGWRDLATMKRSYQRPDPATVLQAVENAPAGHSPDTAQQQKAGGSTT